MSSGQPRLFEFCPTSRRWARAVAGQDCPEHTGRAATSEHRAGLSQSAQCHGHTPCSATSPPATRPAQTSPGALPKLFVLSVTARAASNPAEEECFISNRSLKRQPRLRLQSREMTRGDSAPLTFLVSASPPLPLCG